MSIHLIWGDDLDAIDLFIEKFIQKAIDPNWTSINLSRLDGQKLSEAHQALDESQSPPFGDGERIIVLKNSPICNGCSTELSNHFERIINLIPEKTHLILRNSNKPDGRLKSTKLINKLLSQNKAFVKNFLVPPIWDSIGQRKLIERIASEMNIQFHEDAVIALVDALGNDTQRIRLELEKLALLEETKKNVLQTTIISKNTVDELIQSISSNSLQVCNFLLVENWGEAIYRIDSLLNTGEPALRILAALTTQIRGWLWVSLLEKNETKEVGLIAKQAGITNPKRVYIIRKQIKGKTPVFFVDLLRKVLEIEILLKKGASPKNAFRDGLLSKC
ncbi:DNA polymerase III subunit delta [Prochlorococcus marinus]|uniref:DNA polymerase III subunit delta n=1 Tax=Prochlorococcus marinus TaxID=1219 RepID=UPI0022B5AA49|nr:DNA polymerase III subunit delta [Prochlorococcus marinus]